VQINFAFLLVRFWWPASFGWWIADREDWRVVLGSTGMAGNLGMFLTAGSARGELHDRIFGSERFGEFADAEVKEGPQHPLTRIVDHFLTRRLNGPAAGALGGSA
jgi:hypothetical protein